MIDKKMSALKRAILRKRALKKSLESKQATDGSLPHIAPPEQPGDASELRKKIDALPPLPPAPEVDTRRADEIRRALRAILHEDGGFHAPLPRRKIGLD